VARDLDKLVAHYTGNAIVMAPGMPAADGMSAIRTLLTDMVSDANLSLKFQASRIEISTSGDMGYTQGAYQMTMTDPVSKQVIRDHGSYVTTYSKQPDGSWKAVADIATSELPPQASTTTAKSSK